MDWKQLYTDFKAKYEHCYALVTFEGNRKSEVFWLSYVEPTSSSKEMTAPLLHFENEHTGEVILKYDDSTSDVEFKFPPIGLVPYNNQVFMVRRKFERQWKGGVCNSTLRVDNIYGKLGWQTDGLCSEFLTEAFKSIKPLSIAEGLKQLTTSVAVPLSKEFAIGLSVTSDESPILFYYENPIGKIDLGSNSPILLENQFSQEFEDFTHSVATHETLYQRPF